MPTFSHSPYRMPGVFIPIFHAWPRSPLCLAATVCRCLQSLLIVPTLRTRGCKQSFECAVLSDRSAGSCQYAGCTHAPSLLQCTHTQCCCAIQAHPTGVYRHRVRAGGTRLAREVRNNKVGRTARRHWRKGINTVVGAGVVQGNGCSGKSACQENTGGVEFQFCAGRLPEAGQTGRVQASKVGGCTAAAAAPHVYRPCGAMVGQAAPTCRSAAISSTYHHGCLHALQHKLRQPQAGP